MKKILITLIFTFVCIFTYATSTDKLHVGYTSDMCSDYYVLSMKKDTVYVTYYEYEQGIFAYYDGLIGIKTTRLTPLMNKLSNIQINKVSEIKNEYKKLLNDINTVNPTYHKFKNNYVAFFKIGMLYDKVWKFSDKVNKIIK